MYEVITFGSATRDVFVYSRKFKIIENKESLFGRAFCFDLGSKIEVDKIVFTTGGGGTNTACSFSRLGLKTACVAQVGEDSGGKAAIEELKKENVETKFIIRSEVFNTAYSIIISIPGKERTILVYRGASENINYTDILWEKLKAKWFYITSLGGDLILFKKIIDLAKKNKTKIVINPGFKELEKMYDFLPLIRDIDILILNQEEAKKLTGIVFEKPKEVLQRLKEKVKGIVVMTRGPAGSMVIDNEKIYQAGIIPNESKEKTGAGDAFGSGFVAGMILKNDIKYAIQLGTANAASVIQKIGAKNGLLTKRDLDYFKKVKVSILPIEI